MNFTEHIRRGALVRLHAVQHRFARRHLEAAIATLMEAAIGHEKQGLPPGSPVYVFLNRQSESIVIAFSKRWQISLDQLNAELPVLSRLRRMAEPAPQQIPIVRAAIIVLATMASAFSLGIGAALISLGYHVFGGGR